MKIKALKSFSGADISMFAGEVREYSNKAVLSDLLKAKYIEVVKPEKPKKEPDAKSDDDPNKGRES